MMLKKITVILFCVGLLSFSFISKNDNDNILQEKENIKTLALPNHLNDGTKWEFQEDLSDDFNYTFAPSNQKTNFGNGKWYNFYQSKWDGPGTTYWKYNHVEVDGNDLLIKSSRWKGDDEEAPKAFRRNKMNKPKGGISAGCITSNKQVLYPIFIESKASVANIVLASDVWLLSPDATQEIDIMECYGGKEPGNSHFAKSIHVSHHSFIRKPFTDYQPRDKGAWYNRKGVSGWGEYCWNNGDRKYVRTGVYWKSPVHFEYYIDGELVRVLYDKAVATKVNGKWEFGYPTMTDGKLDKEWGKQKITLFSTKDSYSFSELEKASNASSVSIIDPFKFQGGKGFTKPLNIIINLESQDWHVKADRTPTDADLANADKNTMKVDWFRVFKPKM